MKIIPYDEHSGKKSQTPKGILFLGYTAEKVFPGRTKIPPECPVKLYS
jgi:hypothetical protein